MQERFLHFIWQFQQFDATDLQTTDKQPLQIFRTGLLNTNAGPDFLQARITLQGIEWAGNVEVHIRSSDWQQHQHQQNAAYENVILHVVWEDNQPIRRQDGSVIPTLVLAPRTNRKLLYTYQALLENLSPIPCSTQFAQAKEIYRRQALDKALMNRLQQKAAGVKELYEKNQKNWEETAYQVLAKNFGFKVNSDAMLQLAQSLPLKIIQKHSDSLLQVEALLFGQAGLLPAYSDSLYVQSLVREYQFLRHKYQLESTLSVDQWKFMRLRPANFPTLRIAQLAAFVQTHRFLFSTFLNLQKPDTILSFLEVQTSLYWQQHYHFHKETEQTGSLGEESRNNLVINSLIPLLVAYAEVKDEQAYIDRVVQLLEALPAENNKITRLWKQTGLSVQNAFDSQASIELYNHFCTNKQCLSCPIGVSLLKIV